MIRSPFPSVPNLHTVSDLCGTLTEQDLSGAQGLTTLDLRS